MSTATPRNVLLATDGSAHSVTAVVYYLENFFDPSRDLIHIISVVPVRIPPSIHRRPSDINVYDDIWSDDYSAANRQIVERTNSDTEERTLAAHTIAQTAVNDAHTLINTYCTKNNLSPPDPTLHTPQNPSPRDILTTLARTLRAHILVVGARGSGPLSAPSTPVNESSHLTTLMMTSKGGAMAVHPGGGGLGRVAEYCMHNAGCVVVIVKERQDS